MFALKRCVCVFSPVLAHGVAAANDIAVCAWRCGCIYAGRARSQFVRGVAVTHGEQSQTRVRLNIGKPRKGDRNAQLGDR